MASPPSSFLGIGWSFPPEFAAGRVRMASGEQDIAESLKILFGTVLAERPFAPGYGLSLQPLLFEPLTTTGKTLLEDRLRIGILLHEPRINLLSLSVDVSRQNEGALHIGIEYLVRATNSRFNLVFPYYLGDANERRASRTVAR